MMAGVSSNSVLGSGIGESLAYQQISAGRLPFSHLILRESREGLIPQNAFTSSLEAIPAGWSGSRERIGVYSQTPLSLFKRATAPHPTRCSMHNTFSDTYCMASQGRSWNDHFCTEIGDKPLVANSFPSARLLKNGEVISLFFGSGSRDSNRVRASEKSRNWGGPLRVGEYSTPNADQPFLDQGAKCRPGCSSRPRGSALHNGTAEERPGPSWDVDI